MSNDVFVHILQRGDKVAVLKEMWRLLRPGGVFILNHTMSPAFGYAGYHVDRYCSFLSLDELIKLVVQNTDFAITDIRPTYYMTRRRQRTLFDKLLTAILLLPGGVTLRFWYDYYFQRTLDLEDSDTVYIRLVKPD